MNFWKRFGALGTDFAFKYQSDPFFRTETRIIAFHALFAAFIIGVLIISFINTSYFIGETPTMDSANDPNAVVNNLIATSFEQLEYRRIRNLTLVLSAIVLATLVAGYVLAQVSLKPAREALAQQKIFVGNIAHELRTPLSTLQTNTEVALFDSSLSPALRETLASNVFELNRISDIINNILSLDASLRQDRIAFDRVDLTRIATSVLDVLHPLAEAKKITLVAPAPTPHTVWGNATALEQIVTNILKNAIAYTQAGGRVSVSIAPTPAQMVEIRVEDTGSGIAPADLTHIFEPFFRSDLARNRTRGSSGLGLTIVHELVKLHHGRIMVKSILERGTTVVVHLPTLRTTSRQFPIPPSNEVVVDYSDTRS